MTFPGLSGSGKESAERGGGAVDTADVEASPPPLCKCHGYEMRWQTDRRYPKGGYWRCPERLRRSAEYRQYQYAWARAKYDRDPIHRITKLLHDSARNRAATLARQKAEHRKATEEAEDSWRVTARRTK